MVRALLVAGLLFGLAAGTAAQAPAAGEDGPAAGKRLYAAKCARCHGANMVNPGTLSYDLRKFPEADAERFRNSVISGKGAMPAWQGVLSEEEIGALWVYVLTRGQP